MIAYLLLICCVVLPLEAKRVALCYFGLTRTVKQTYPSHVAQIFRPLEEAEIEFDIFMHTWKIEGKQFVGFEPCDTPVDYEEYRLLQPTYYRIDDQSAFLQSVRWNDFFYQEVWDKYGHGEEAEWLPQLLKNHLCALQSQKIVTQMVETSGQSYDYIIYIRPDARFITPLNGHELLSLEDGEVMIPNEMWCAGYNDRFAMLTYHTAPIYGKRIDHLAEYRKHHGRIVSEKYLKYVLDTNRLRIRPIELQLEFIRP